MGGRWGGGGAVVPGLVIPYPCNSWSRVIYLSLKVPRMLDLKVRERAGGGAWGEELDLPPTICVNNKNF